MYQRNFFRQIAIDLCRNYYKFIDHLRDYKLGVHSCEEISVQHLTANTSLQAQAKKYQATPYKILERVFDTLKPLGLKSHHFIDYGCGMGRVLIEAHLHGYKNLTGLEISSRALGICNSNLRHYPDLYRRAQLRKLNGADFLPPDEHSVVFLFNPFSDETMLKVINKLNYSRGHKIVVYVNPIYAFMFKEQGARLIARENHFYNDFSFDVYYLPASTAKSNAEINRDSHLTSTYGPDSRRSTYLDVISST